MKKSKIFVITIVLFMPMLLAAKGGSGDPGFLSGLMGDLVLFAGGLTFLGAVASLLISDGKMMEFHEREILKERGITLPEDEASTTNEPSFFTKVYDWLAGLKPMDEEKDLMLDHNYDGIKELDNSLPPWWLAMFYITVIIAPIYIYYFHISDNGVLQHEEYAIEMRQAEQARLRYLARQTNIVTEKNVVALTDPGELASGQAIYVQNCVACHGTKGEGGVGPNMADDYWIHGGDIKSIFKTIKYGVPEKGMIAWKAQLPPSQIQQVASFLMTFKGTNPPNGKAPQGELYVPEDAAGDSTQVTQSLQ